MEKSSLQHWTFLRKFVLHLFSWTFQFIKLKWRTNKQTNKQTNKRTNKQIKMFLFLFQCKLNQNKLVAGSIINCRPILHQWRVNHKIGLSLCLFVCFAVCYFVCLFVILFVMFFCLFLLSLRTNETSCLYLEWNNFRKSFFSE